MTKKIVGYQIWAGDKTVYVSNLPGKDGKDYEYTENNKLALNMTDYQAKMFRSYQMKLSGAKGRWGTTEYFE